MPVDFTVKLTDTIAAGYFICNFTIDNALYTLLTHFITRNWLGKIVHANTNGTIPLKGILLTYATG